MKRDSWLVYGMFTLAGAYSLLALQSIYIHLVIDIAEIRKILLHDIAIPSSIMLIFLVAVVVLGMMLSEQPKKKKTVATRRLPFYPYENSIKLPVLTSNPEVLAEFGWVLSGVAVSGKYAVPGVPFQDGVDVYAHKFTLQRGIVLWTKERLEAENKAFKEDVEN